MYHVTMTNTERILIIDDDARLRELLLRYLSEQGFSAKAVGEGAALDKALLLNRYHLLVLDLMLPGEDGLAILRRLRAAGEHVPVILLTAKGDEIDRIIGLEMGADDYLPNRSTRANWWRASMRCCGARVCRPSVRRIPRKNLSCSAIAS